MKPVTRFRSGVRWCALVLLASASSVSGQGTSAVHLVTAERSASGVLLTRTEFVRKQLEHPRVRRAQLIARPRINRLFFQRDIAHPAAELFLRVFKRERVLEAWVRPAGQEEFELLESYSICAAAGKPGPKTLEGDGQVPEGFYYIDMLNPDSEYYLSMRINYPNTRDILANRGQTLGGDIYLHGGCRSEGCLAMTNGGIEELYWLVVEARAIGQERVPVHIFPARLDDAEMDQSADVFADQPQLLEFWRTLKPAYDHFEATRRVPRMHVNALGQYHVARFADMYADG